MNLEQPNDASVASPRPDSPRFDATQITRPAPQLLTYYLIVSFIIPPAAIFTLPFLWFRYATLRYQFDEEGVSMSWGFLFKREILLTYRRIQDIHLTRGLLQRWLGLATLGVQTASGSSAPEMNIEGILEAEQLRDFLYKKMRGAKGLDGDTDGDTSAPANDQVTELLTSIRDHLATAVHSRSDSAGASQNLSDNQTDDSQSDHSESDDKRGTDQ